MPVDELDAELEGALGVRDKIVLIHAEHAVERADRRDSRFTYSNGPYLIGLDQCDRHARVLDHAREPRPPHPSCGTPADNDDFSDRIDHATPKRRMRAASSSSRWVGNVRQAKS